MQCQLHVLLLPCMKCMYRCSVECCNISGLLHVYMPCVRACDMACVNEFVVVCTLWSACVVCVSFPDKLYKEI